MDVSVEIHCEVCGSANYSLPEDEDAPIRCNDCGSDQGSLAELRAALLLQALEHSADRVRRALDKLAAGDLEA